MELGSWGEGMEGEGGSPSATGPLLPSNSPHFAFPRPNLPLLLLSLSPSHLCSPLTPFILLKPKNIRSHQKSLPSQKLFHPQNNFVSSKGRLHLSSSLPSNSQHFAFPPALLDAGGEGGLPGVFPHQVHSSSFLWHLHLPLRPLVCRGSPGAGS